MRDAPAAVAAFQHDGLHQARSTRTAISEMLIVETVSNRISKRSAKHSR